MPKPDRISTVPEEISAQRDNHALFKVDELVKDHLLKELQLLRLAAHGLCDMSSHSVIEPRHCDRLLRQIARALDVAHDVSERLDKIRGRPPEIEA